MVRVRNSPGKRGNLPWKYLGAGMLVGLAILQFISGAQQISSDIIDSPADSNSFGSPITAKPHKTVTHVSDVTATATTIESKSKSPASRIPTPEKKEAAFLPGLATNWSDKVYSNLLAEGKEAMTQNPSNGILHSMEVGMHSAKQCLEAAHNGLQAHCVEPSPNSFSRIDNGIKRDADRKNVKFYQLAASDTSGLDLQFLSAGGTGDHVGGGAYNVWTMTKKELTAEEEEAMKKKQVTVKSVAIDDIIYNKVGPTVDYSLEEANSSVASSLPNIDKLFLLKVDVQGHEPSVFSGITKAISEHKIDFVLTEYWPKGIDFMNDSMGAGKECLKPVGILQSLVDSGYTLYALSTHSDPRAPKDGALDLMKKHNKGSKLMPTDTLMEHCMWFYDLERKYRDGDGMSTIGGVYEFGYWTDVLAVRPGFKFPVAPVTETGKIIAQS